MSMENIRTALPQAITMGMSNVVVGGQMYRDVPLQVTFVTSQTDLAAITDSHPGDIAIAYGFTSMWQLAADGTTWTQI